MDGHPAATVSVTHHRYGGDLPSTPSARVPGLRPMLRRAAISVEAVQPVTMDISASARESNPRAWAPVHDMPGRRT
jgi:hypothetical protein